MPVAVKVRFNGATLDQYDAIQEKLGLPSGASGPPGLIFHWVTAVDGGIEATDVWESEAAFGAFAEGKIGPAAAEIGVAGPPDVTFIPIHAYLTAATN